MTQCSRYNIAINQYVSDFLRICKDKSVDIDIEIDEIIFKGKFSEQRTYIRVAFRQIENKKTALKLSHKKKKWHILKTRVTENNYKKIKLEGDSSQGKLEGNSYRRRPGSANMDNIRQWASMTIDNA